mgnify:CR=1 FL=1
MRQLPVEGQLPFYLSKSIGGMILLEKLNKTYPGVQPLHVLKDIDLSISQGEYVAIMGASGSGKSTLLNVLGILDDYDTGRYLLDGKLIAGLSEKKAAIYRNKMIGFVFQSFNLISFKNAMENVALPLFYKGVARKKRNHPQRPASAGFCISGDPIAFQPVWPGLAAAGVLARGTAARAVQSVGAAAHEGVEAVSGCAQEHRLDGGRG